MSSPEVSAQSTFRLNKARLRNPAADSGNFLGCSYSFLTDAMHFKLMEDQACYDLILVFFRNTRSWHYCHFCTTSNANNLQPIANQMSLDANYQFLIVH